MVIYCYGNDFLLATESILAVLNGKRIERKQSAFKKINLRAVSLQTDEFGSVVERI